MHTSSFLYFNFFLSIFIFNLKKKEIYLIKFEKNLKKKHLFIYIINI